MTTATHGLAPATTAWATDSNIEYIRACIRGFIRNDPALVDDLVQDTLLTVSRKANQFEGRSRFKTWLYMVARSTVLMHFRRQKSRPRLVVMPYERPSEWPEDRLMAREELSRVLEAIDDLPAKYRRVMQLRIVENKSLNEIADEMELSVGGVKSRMSRARDMLRVDVGIAHA